jgi:hypothetical protein
VSTIFWSLLRIGITWDFGCDPQFLPPLDSSTVIEGHSRPCSPSFQENKKEKEKKEQGMRITNI